MIRARISYRSLILLSTLLTLVLSAAPPPWTPQILALNDTSLLSKSSNQTTTDTAPSRKCSERRFLRTDKRPTWAECYQATRLLPTTHNTGTFHDTAFNDVWRLPRIAKFGRCRAKVEIEPRARVASSWVAVKSALDELGILCRRSSSPGPERVAGWMLIGEGGKIKVSFLKPHHDPGPEIAEAWNGTAAE